MRNCPKARRASAWGRRLRTATVVLTGLVLAGCSAPVVDPVRAPDAGGLTEGVFSKAEVSRAVAALPTRDNPRCLITSVVDGDTVRIRCRTGEAAVRLLGYDTPETHTPACPGERVLGLRATRALQSLLAQGSVIVPHTRGRDKYRRPLVALTVDGVPVADSMIALGLARPYDGGKRQGWC